MKNYWILLAIPLLCGVALAAAPPAGQGLSDQKVMFAVERLLELDDTVVSGLIDVQVQDGIVTLSGAQDDLMSKRRAAEIAETVKGVRSVINRIALEPAEQSDSQIQTAIVNVLLDDPGTNSFPNWGPRVPRSREAFGRRQFLEDRPPGDRVSGEHQRCRRSRQSDLFCAFDVSTS